MLLSSTVRFGVIGSWGVTIAQVLLVKDKILSGGIAHIEDDRLWYKSWGKLLNNGCLYIIKKLKVENYLSTFS